jgi:hypothetical protein
VGGGILDQLPGHQQDEVVTELSAAP